MRAIRAAEEQERKRQQAGRREMGAVWEFETSFEQPQPEAAHQERQQKERPRTAGWGSDSLWDGTLVHLHWAEKRFLLMASERLQTAMTLESQYWV